jgi:hypothetical protein
MRGVGKRLGVWGEERSLHGCPVSGRGSYFVVSTAVVCICCLAFALPELHAANAQQMLLQSGCKVGHLLLTGVFVLYSSTAVVLLLLCYVSMLLLHTGLSSVRAVLWTDVLHAACFSQTGGEQGSELNQDKHIAVLALAVLTLLGCAACQLTLAAAGDTVCPVYSDILYHGFVRRTCCP